MNCIYPKESNSYKVCQFCKNKYDCLDCIELSNLQNAENMCNLICNNYEYINDYVEDLRNGKIVIIPIEDVTYILTNLNEFGINTLYVQQSYARNNIEMYCCKVDKVTINAWKTM